MEKLTILHLLNGLSDLAWIALGIFAVYLIAMIAAFLRRWRSAGHFEPHEEILHELRRAEVAIFGRLQSLVCDGVVVAEPGHVQGAPPWVSAASGWIILERVLDGLKGQGGLLESLLRKVVRSGGAAALVLAEAAMDVVDDADAHGDRKLAFLYVGAPAAGAAGTMSGVTSALHEFQLDLGSGLTTLPLGGLNDALLTTYAGCALVILTLLVRNFLSRGYSERLVAGLAERSGEVCEKAEALDGLLTKIRKQERLLSDGERSERKRPPPPRRASSEGKPSEGNEERRTEGSIA